MRAVAVLAVFANHLFDWPSGGFVGVDVFFVLSGFFITGLLIRDRTTKRELPFRDFYVRRVKRILPSALLVLTVTVIGSYLLFPATRAKSTLIDALYAAVFASNFRFQAVGADYFQQGQPPSPLQHYWSLSIEEQFYFVWPALLALIFTLTQGLSRSKKKSTRQWGLFGAMSVIVLASFGWALFLSARNPNSAYFSTFTRVWELGVGAMVAIAGPWLVRIPSSIRPVLAYLGLAGVVGSLFLIDSTVQFPAPWAALPVLSTALVVASFHGAEVRGMPLLTNKVAGYLGDTSYTLYLWHWPVIILLLSVIPKGPFFYGAAVALALGLTVVTYRFYEDPIRKSHWLLSHPETEKQRRLTGSPLAWGIIGGVAATLIVMTISFTQYADKISAAQEQSRSAVQKDQTQSTTSTPAAEKADRCFGAPAMVTPGCVQRNPDVPLQPSIDEFANDKGSQLECFHMVIPGQNDSGDEQLQPCEYGYNGPDATRIALIGDSHAAAFLPALVPILDANKWRLTTYLGTGCHFADPAPAECQGQMPQVEAEILAKHYDLVLVTNFNQHLQPERYQKAWAPVAAAGSRIAVVLDNPQTSEEALACLTRVSVGGDDTGGCGTPRAEALPRADSLAAAAQLVPDTTLIDLTRYYCTAERCPSVIGNVIVYRDFKRDPNNAAYGNSHTTAVFASTLAGPVEEGLRRALGARPDGPP